MSKDIGQFLIDGVSYFFSLLKQEEQKKLKQGAKSKNLQTEPSSKSVAISQPITVALCLIVPASLVKELRENDAINISNIETLINNAPYFICTTLANCESIENGLKFTDENILTISERRDVYIKIHIPDGQEMLDKKVPYILERNLPSHAQAVVEKIACLDDLSGLKIFNRV